MRYFLICTTIGLLFTSNAQSGWKKKFPFPTSVFAVCVDAMESPSGNLMMVGYTIDTLNGVSTTYLTVMGSDKYGNKQWEKRYKTKFPLMNSPWKGRFLQESDAFYMVTCLLDTNNKTTAGLIKINYNGDTLWHRIFKAVPPKDLVPCGVCRSVDGGFLITGFSQDWALNTRPCLLIKTNNNGMELWRRYISKSQPDLQIGGSILQDNDTKKIIIVGSQAIGTQTTPTTYSNILILDSVGNTIKQTTYNNHDGGGFSSLTQLRNKTFVTGGGYNMENNLGNFTRYKSLIVNFDLSGTILNSSTHDTTSPFNGIYIFQERANGDLICTGILDTMLNYNISEKIRVRVICTDSNGTVKWKRFVVNAPPSFQSEHAPSLRSVSDGGFIMATNFVWDNTNYFSVIKIDSSGCDTIPGFCQYEYPLSTNKNSKSEAFSIYPNPASDRLFIEAPANFSEATIVLLDLMGRPVIRKTFSGSKQSIDLDQVRNGIYFVNILSGERLIYSRKISVDK
jgi:hypothetical protein